VVSDGGGGVHSKTVTIPETDIVSDSGIHLRSGFCRDVRFGCSDGFGLRFLHMSYSLR
jgi:hypothetical protein